MKHTYILKTGNWKASGKFFDENNNFVEIIGESKILHHETEWVLDGYMELKLDPPVIITNKYAIQPLQPNSDFTFWNSSNPALGRLMGSFMMFPDSILSSYHSEDGAYTGTECLYLINSEKYLNRGFAFHKKKKLSSWEVTLKRNEA